MTADFGRAVRYRAQGDHDYGLQSVTGIEEQRAVLRRLRTQGFEATPVALTWKVLSEPELTEVEGE